MSIDLLGLRVLSVYQWVIGFYVETVTSGDVPILLSVYQWVFGFYVETVTSGDVPTLAMYMRLYILPVEASAI